MLQTYIGDAAHATLLEVAKECMYHEIMHYEKWNTTRIFSTLIALYLSTYFVIKKD
jgi:hypothetical protein